MKRQLLLALLIVFTIDNTSAQTYSGQVLNQGGQGLTFVNVYTNSRLNHAHTDDAGNFTLQGVNKGDTIIVSLIGFESVRQLITDVSKKATFTLKKKTIELKDVVIEYQKDALNLFSNINVQTAPVQNSQEVLLKVPGLMIGQHAGGGKAEQIFLRGFDIDHGTDIGITVENMPVNMVSHAHGQGYADMHFVIPETIDKINFGKGPYDADKGNFSTAGSVDLQLKKKLDNSLIKIEGGQFNSKRFLGMLNVLNTKKQQAYIATEFNTTDGPFERSQNFSRTNFMARYNAQLANNNNITVSASHFTSRWDASGQIPVRAVESGQINRFGAIDDTEGGQTSRSNIWLQHTKILPNEAYVKSNFFYSNYQFELFSNFTFFLDDSINGDQIRQYENRNLYGGTVEYGKNVNLFSNPTLIKTGISYRQDESRDNELSHTKNRKTTLEQYQYGDIDETNLSAYTNAELEVGKFVFQPGLRADYFSFNYNDKLSPTYNPLGQESIIVSPKFNILYNYNSNLQLYFKSGKGFHSNDSRVVLNRADKKNLPAAYGTDLGLIWKAAKNLVINAALWQLYLEQEFVYVGDAGIIEPSGKTNRQGIDLSMRYQPKKWLFVSGDLNYAHARAADAEAGNAYIPLAPALTASASLQVIHPSGIFGGIRIRHMGNRAANEDYSIVAKGYTITDANIGYGFKKVEFGMNVKNVFNIDWNETQFATTSRLRNESQPIEEIHFTPGTPFALSAYCSFKF